MGWECSSNGGKKKHVYSSEKTNVLKIAHLQDQEGDGRIILK
jgi:hypothetical protein